MTCSIQCKVCAEVKGIVCQMWHKVSIFLSPKICCCTNGTVLSKLRAGSYFTSKHQAAYLVALCMVGKKHVHV